MSLDYSKKSVLLIESSGNLRSSVKDMLLSMGFGQVVATTIASSSLEDVASEPYDLILLGHNINDRYSGLQLLEEARYKNLIKPTCSWILMTSDASQQSVLFAIEIQPDEVLTKPFTLDDLSQRIHQLCARRAALEPVERAIERKAINRALALCDRLLKPSNPNYAQAQMIKGALLLEQQQYADAKAVFESLYWAAEALLPGYKLAECYYHLAEFDSAKDLLERLIGQHRLLIPAYDLLAKVYEAMGEPQAAQQMLKRAVDQSPLSISRQLELGRMAVGNDDLDQAAKAYRRCIHLGATSCLDSAAPYLKLANVNRLQLDKLNGHERQDALEEIDRLVDKAGQRFESDPMVQVQVRLVQAKVHEALGEVDKAQQCYQQALERAESAEMEVDLDQIRGELLDEVKPAPPQPAQAEPEVETGSKVDPEMSAKVNRIGVRNYLADKPGQAIRYFGLAFEYDPTNAKALLNLSQLFLEAARDTPSRSDERMKMHLRYLRLAQRLTMSGGIKSQCEQLKHLSKQPLDQLPQGPLMALLK